MHHYRPELTAKAVALAGTDALSELRLAVLTLSLLVVLIITVLAGAGSPI